MTSEPLFRVQMRAAILLVACLAGPPGCAGITVHRVRAPDPLLAAANNSGTTFHATELTYLTPERLLALSEAGFSHARAAEKLRSDDALALYAASAGYAYQALAALTDDDAAATRAQTLYNAALAHCLELAVRAKRLSAADALELPSTSGGSVPVAQVGFVRRPASFGEIELCCDFRVSGLEHQFHAGGAGVPLIVRCANTGRHPEDSHLPEGGTFAATAVLHFDVHEARATRLELINPLTASTVEIGGQSRPLAADLTTPLAVCVVERNAFQLDYLGFLRANKLTEYRGIHMLEPYEPGKIPVILVHGLLSSPITWAPLLNELRGDPLLRERFQFWACYYPTGHPFLGSAHEVRTDIARLRDELDPQHRDAAFEQMVLIGHSMGGLISKLVTQEGGPDLWPIVSAIPLENLDLSAPLREKLQQTFFFAREKGVTRVIFIGTPHHGASLSRSPAGWLAAHLVKFRTDLADYSREMVERIPDLPYKHLPTSIDLLAPDSPTLRILAARPAPPGVHYHSIIGVEPAGWRPFRQEAGDGIVAYKSAHVDGVESELVVPASHFTVHQSAATFTEVRRILLEHLKAVPGSEGVLSSRVIPQ